MLFSTLSEPENSDIDARLLAAQDRLELLRMERIAHKVHNPSSDDMLVKAGLLSEVLDEKNLPSCADLIRATAHADDQALRTNMTRSLWQLFAASTMQREARLTCVQSVD